MLDLRKQLTGGTVDPPSQDSTLRWSYDAEMDAVYLHVGEGPGQVQRRSTDGRNLIAAADLSSWTSV